MNNTTPVNYKFTTFIDKKPSLKYKITTLRDKTTPVKYKITTLIDNTTPFFFLFDHNYVIYKRFSLCSPWSNIK